MCLASVHVLNEVHIPQQNATVATTGGYFLKGHELANYTIIGSKRSVMAALIEK